MKRIEPTEFRYTVTEASYSALVTADDVRAFAIIDETADTAIDAADEALINLLITSAIKYWIDFTGVFPINAAIVAELDYSPGDRSSLDFYRAVDCWLRYAPIQSVTKIYGLNEDATEDVLASTDYVIDKEHGIIRSLDWPSGDKDLGSFRISYTAGLGATASNTPEEVKTAIKMMVTHWFEYRQPTTEAAIFAVPHHAQAILNKYKPTRL